jgi:hypothetical protein
MQLNYGQPRVGDSAYASSFISFIVAGSDTGSQTDDSTGTGGGPTTTGGGNSTTGSGNSTTGTGGTTTGGGNSTTGTGGTTTGGSNSTTGGGNTTTTGGGKTTTGGGKTTTTGGGKTTTTGGGKTSTGTGGTTTGGGTTSNSSSAASRYYSTTVPASIALNMHVFANRNATEALISSMVVLAVERAFMHELNEGLSISAAESDEILAILREHARISTEHAKGILAGSPLRPAFNQRHMQILAHLRFPQVSRPQFQAAHRQLESQVRSILRGTRQVVTLESFSASRSYRVTHNADIVPHVPPEDFGYTHATEEVWYVEDQSTYTACSVKNGEDAKCSDSIALPTSISDHLNYVGIPISNLC